MTSGLLRTPLYDRHVASGGRLVPFAGYEMPVQYASIIAEAKAVRSGAGMFDVSHMARLTLRGSRVLEFVEKVTSNDASKLVDGGGQYSLLPNEKGGTVDDIIVYRISSTEFRLVVNASNHDKDVSWLNENNSDEIEFIDETESTAMIAVQGPSAAAILASLSDSPDEVTNASMFGIVNTRIAGIQCFAPRSGYTGEDGYELICAAADTATLWGALVGAGVAPCGLGARDTLRVEAGLPLYGHELTDELSPIAAGLGWVVSKTKSFIGSEPIQQTRTTGVSQRLVGVKLTSKRLIAPGMAIHVEGQSVGEVSSGVVSPLFDCGLALGFVDAKVPFGTACTIDIRGKQEPGEVVSKRFYVRRS